MPEMKKKKKNMKIYTRENKAIYSKWKYKYSETKWIHSKSKP